MVCLYVFLPSVLNMACLPITDLFPLYLTTDLLLPCLRALDCLKSGVLTSPSESRMSSNSFAGLASENYSSNSDHSDDESAPRVRSSTFHEESARKAPFSTRTQWEVC